MQRQNVLWQAIREIQYLIQLLSKNDGKTWVKGTNVDSCQLFYQF